MRERCVMRVAVQLESFLGAFAEFQEAAINLVVYVCPHDKIRLLLGGFSRNLMFENFSNICGENSSVIKI